MKYIVLIGDGMSDYPIDSLDGRTPLEAAKKPNMDCLARKGRVGTSITVPKHMTPASDVANLSIMGYDPNKYYSGRGPLEAANIGVELDEGDVAFRCNLITATDDILSDYSAGHIANKEAEALIKYLDSKLGSDSVKFYPGMSYRHLTVFKASPELVDLKCTPPHNVTGQSISHNLPKGKRAEFIIKLMNDSRELLSENEVNKVRIDLGENPGNMIWLWGQGVKPRMDSFQEKYGLTGSVISAVDLIKGIGKVIGLDPIKVPGATGYYDTDYKAKADYALRSLKDKDFVYLHVEAPDEAGHNGHLSEKIKAIENFDRLVVGTMVEGLKTMGEFRMLILPDHATPVALRTHTRDPIPFLIYGSGVQPGGVMLFTEKAATAGGFKIEKGWELMDYLVKRKVL